MKKSVTEERTVCDFCKVNDAAYSKCTGCGKDICYECKTIHAISYDHAVYFQGSGDGLYCVECDRRLRAAQDPLHMAYEHVKALRNEMVGWGENFKKRSDAAEAKLKRLQTARP